jgi:hypothetical protein
MLDQDCSDELVLVHPNATPIPESKDAEVSGEALDAMLKTSSANDTKPDDFEITDDVREESAKHWASQISNLVLDGNLTMEEAVEFLSARNPEFRPLYNEFLTTAGSKGEVDNEEVFEQTFEDAVDQELFTPEARFVRITNGGNTKTNPHVIFPEIDELIAYSRVVNEIEIDLKNGRIRIENVIAVVGEFIDVNSIQGHNEFLEVIKRAMITGEIPVRVLDFHNSTRDVDIWNYDHPEYKYQVGRMRFGVLTSIERTLSDEGPNFSLSVDDEVTVNRVNVAGRSLNPEVTYLITAFKQGAYNCICVTDGQNPIWVSPRVIKEIVVD